MEADNQSAISKRCRFKKSPKTMIQWLVNAGFVSELGVQWWRSGENTRLPPMWPGFDSQTRRHTWVEFVGSLPCTERFSPGTPVSPAFDLICVVVNFSL